MTSKAVCLGVSKLTTWLAGENIEQVLRNSKNTSIK